MNNASDSEKFLTEACHIVQTSTQVRTRGAGTKSVSVGNDSEDPVIDMRQFSGILQYDPGEFTFTVRAGTRLSEIRDALAEQGQYMPFDPPLIEAGATIGGTVAAGLNGSGRVLYGGIRDFILGVQFIDGHGDVHRGGGKVVKNAAGFDLPKFFVGSLGRFGILTEFCFKVFPEPPAYRTLIARFSELNDALNAMNRLSVSGLQFTAVDISRNNREESISYDLVIRICGDASATNKHEQRIARLIESKLEQLVDDADKAYWSAVSEFKTPQDDLQSESILIKVPLTTAKIIGLESSLQDFAFSRYSAFGNVAWIFVMPDQLEKVDQILQQHELSGLVVCGDVSGTDLGIRSDNVFAEKIKFALDPEGKFGPIYDRSTRAGATLS